MRMDSTGTAISSLAMEALEVLEGEAFGRFLGHLRGCCVCASFRGELPQADALCPHGADLMRAWDRAEAAIAEAVLAGAG